jgi:exodeoxyribonuclease VII large subunit
MLFYGTVQVYDAGGRLTFHVADVLPEFTLGQVELRRRNVLELLRKEGLLLLNKTQSMPALPLRIGLLTSESGDGLHDFLMVLRSSGYRFTVYHFHVPVQGPEMETAICKALTLIDHRQPELNLDLICLVRGGGNSTDLGWWDNYAIGASIARMRLPVICGIGHEKNHVVVDDVVHTRLATPTAAAHFLVQKMHAADTQLQDLRRQVVDLSRSLLDGQRQLLTTQRTSVCDLASSAQKDQMARLRRLVDLVSICAKQAVTNENTRLRDNCSGIYLQPKALVSLARQQLHKLSSDLKLTAQMRIRQERQEICATCDSLPSLVQDNLGKVRQDLVGTSKTLALAAAQRVQGEEREFRHLKEKLMDATDRTILQERQRMSQVQQLVEAFDPADILRRGYSITYDESGKWITKASQLKPGASINTILEQGRIRSTVTATHNEDEKGAP